MFCRCKAASARTWATAGTGLREGSMEMDMAAKRCGGLARVRNPILCPFSPYEQVPPYYYQKHSCQRLFIKRYQHF
jgi:hypothetical protein